MVANSLGGKLPGDDIVLAEHGDPTTHPHPYYTPVAHIGDKYLLEPVAFGMRFAGYFAGASMIPVDFNPGSVNATAYAAKHADGTTIVAVINKDLSQNLALNLPGFHAEYALTAPTVDARQASLAATTQASLTHTLPHTSAAIFRSR
jgi:hypothetical protein